MKDIQSGLGVQNIFDLVLKEIYDIYKPKSLTKEQIKKKKMVHLPETKKELKSICRQETQILFTEISLTKLAFNMIWLMENQKI